MKKTIGLICSVSGIIGGVLMIVAGFMEDSFPKPMRLLAAALMLINAVYLCTYVVKDKNKKPS